ncbi:MAG TPA: caspase family protein [Pyrinomonadaceae bacterium]|jgi:WD40 repeat protein
MQRKFYRARPAARVFSLALGLCAALSLTTGALAQRPDTRGLGLPGQPTPTPAQTPAPQKTGAAVRPTLVLQTGYPAGGATSLTYSPDGRLIATTTFLSSQVKLWEAATGRELRGLAVAGGTGSDFLQAASGVTAVAFSRDGRLVAAGARDNVITVWEVKTGRTTQTLRAQSDSLLAGLGVLALAFSPDGRQLVSFGDALRTWDVASGQVTRETPLEDAAGDDVGTFGGALALSADGSQSARLARSAKGTRRAVKLYELTTGRELRSVNLPDDFPDYGAAVLALTPDGRVLSAALADVAGGQPKLKLYDLSARNGRTLAQVAATAGLFRFSPDGRWLAFAEGGNVRVWETATGTERQPFKVDKPAVFAAQPEVIGAVGFSPDSKALAASVYGGPINVWEVETGRVAQRLEGHSNFAFNVAFSPDGTRLVSGGKTVWDLITGRGQRAAPTSEPFGLVSPDGRLLAALTNADGRVTLYDTNTQRRLFTLAPDQTAPPPTLKTNKAGAAKAPNAVALPPAFSPDGRLLATTYRLENFAPSPEEQQQELKAQQKAAQEALKKAAKNPGAYQQIYQAELAKLNAARAPSLANQIKLWDTQTGREARTITLPGGNGLIPTLIQHVVFSEDGRQLAVVQFNNPAVTVWDVATGAQVRTIGAPPASTSGGVPDVDANDPFGVLGGGALPGFSGAHVSAVAFSADGRLFATGGLERRGGFDPAAIMSQVGALTRNPQARVDPKTIQQQLLKQMQQATTTGTLKLYDAQTGREVRAFDGHTSEVQAVALSRDARLVASAAADNSIKLWDAQTGRELFTLAGHTSQINSLAFSPDARLLASASNDGSTLLWDTQTGRQLATLVSLYDGGEWLVITPDGLFDGSPQAWNQVLWRYDEDTFNVAPIEWFFTEFFAPGLLADLVRGQRPRAAQDFAGKDRRQPKVTVSLMDADAAAPVAARAVKVRLDVREDGPDETHRAGSGARDLRLFRNGSLVRVWRGDVLQGKQAVTLETTLPLVAGENRLTAYAFNRDNVKSRDANLKLTGADALKRAGTAYVLAVGVNEYANTQYNLRYAVADAQEFGTEIERQQEKLGRFDKVLVTTLVNREATKANILAALARLAASAQPEDEVIVFFAGHGTAQQNQFYLLPHDLGYTGSRTQLDATGLRTILAHSISDRELELAFEQVGAGQLLLVLDACNSGQALEAEEKRRGPMNSKGLAQLAYEKGMYILTAAQSFQAAQEAAQLGHGLLTYALVEEGLKQGLADAEPKDGVVLAREWFDYASTRVPAMQLERVRQTRDLSFSSDDARGLDPNGRVAQRPRPFYRRELEAQPLVVAKP